jgi:hypothetical protein
MAGRKDGSEQLSSPNSSLGCFIQRDCTGFGPTAPVGIKEDLVDLNSVPTFSRINYADLCQDPWFNI